MSEEKLSTALHQDAANMAAPTGTSNSVALNADDLLKTILNTLEDSKAEEIEVIDITGKSALGDYMVIASGRSHRHVGAVADKVIRDVKTTGVKAPRAEGLPSCDWVLIDAGDVICHIFRPEVREFYALEKMWSAPDVRETSEN